ncbi:acetyltransferase [Ktedonosporobacter rubrisoli]|uniref:Acetyltransferase n=1 Tax=Ktedonosporobacter rubrisoli TaxID=2509675 RepID=A0A4P6JMM8_KTERU|nr:DapH/DapD/GlmU-related protein [Ktedonosporobacter rubrisoli]QBD76519.1 acetyltransferase [Ktedonosporobacter rubrisoli]
MRERLEEVVPQWQHALSEPLGIHPSARLIESTCGDWTAIGAGSVIQETSIGDYSYTGDSVEINYATIGKFCSIASHVCINPGNHPMERVMQHHATYRRVSYGFAPTDDESIFERRRAQHVTIGHDVWIGRNAIILPGNTIGTGAVIGAGAVVTHDIDPYTIAVGVPARPLRARFPQEIAAQLLKIAWWDWPRELLVERFSDFNDLPAFLARYSEALPES